MIPRDDGSGDRDGDRKRWAAAADQRPGQQRHGPARQQHPGQGGDLGDDQPAQRGHRGDGRQGIQRMRQDRRARNDTHRHLDYRYYVRVEAEIAAPGERNGW